ncbi:hypothetical protein C8Q73DRAFT_474213 [Cubamyces lactineus]|nr:hypothetical protein C8Q73DRAFT_474213 [Cubamyces lactineus]
MAARIRELSMNRTSSYQQDRTSSSHSRDLNKFSHIQGPNPSYADHPDVDGNPLGHVRSTGPTSTTAATEPESQSTADPARAPTEEGVTTPGSQDMVQSNDEEQGTRTCPSLSHTQSAPLTLT